MCVIAQLSIVLKVTYTMWPSSLDPAMNLQEDTCFENIAYEQIFTRATPFPVTIEELFLQSMLWISVLLHLMTCFLYQIMPIHPEDRCKPPGSGALLRGAKRETSSRTQQRKSIKFSRNIEETNQGVRTPCCRLSRWLSVFECFKPVGKSIDNTL